MKKTDLNEKLKKLFCEVEKNGYITEQQIRWLKTNSNKIGKDICNCDMFEKTMEKWDVYGIPVTEEQGQKGLKWLKKFIRRNGESDVYGFREIDIINNALPTDFTFCGFYNDENGFYGYFLPVYNLNGMEYVPKEKPYITC